MRLYRLLLLLFPAAFRRRFGDDMADAFEDRWRTARRESSAAAVGLWFGTIADIVTHGVAERRAASLARRRHSGRYLMLQQIAQDVRYAVRTFRRRPGFTAVALVTLALGIGANTAIFSVVHAVLIRDLPYPEADRIVRVYEMYQRNRNRGPVNPFTFDRWERESPSFERLAAFVARRATLTGSGNAERLRVYDVMPSFFDVLGVRPALGRPFDDADARTNARVLLMSHRIWTSRFGADPGIVGRTVVLEGEPWIVGGVMPPAFDYPQEAAFWRPLHLSPADRELGRRWYLGVIGRLKPDVSLARAQGSLDLAAEHLARAHPETFDDRNGWLIGLHDDLVSEIGDGLRVLQAIVVIVLLIACANLANLLLAATTARRRELGIRLSAGAGRWRVVRQLLTESLLLASAGGALGVTGAYWGVPLLVRLAPEAIQPTFTEIGVSLPALAFTLAVSALCGLVFGSVPALVASRAEAIDLVRGGAGTRLDAGRSLRTLRSGLIAGEVALAFVLLAGALLLITSVIRLTSQDPGFAKDHLVTAELTLPQDPYAAIDARRAFWNGLMARVQSLPGVTAVAASTALPFSNWESQSGFQIHGRADSPEPLVASVRTVTPGYFEMMSIPVRAGRTFVEADVRAGDSVVVVNDVFARRFFGDAQAVGRHLRTNPRSDRWMTVVGVVGSTRHVALDREPVAELYWPYGQNVPATFILAVRTRGDAPGLPAALRGMVDDLDPRVPVQSIATMTDLIDGTTARRRFHRTLLALFASLAGVLASVGIYGVVTFAVSQRWRELGIRSALGARPAAVTALVMQQVLTPVCAGLVLGWVLGLQVGGVLEAELFGVAPTDAATLSAASAVFLGVAALASYLPARRARRSDPLQILRAE
ncbi:MAG TPA: ABC transporter permease [Vicinamibacterales bacterium]|nr:ABC transporter permease [Vicinamibacterales bacterium]